MRVVTRDQMTDFFQRPNLAGVITTDDVSTKGQGNFKADYVNWARIAHLLHVHAPGWEFHLRMSPDQQGYVWRAPNDTGFVVGYFTGPEHQQTPDFPQSVMDNRNAPIPFERISARDVTDTHRRCLCTTAAYSFGLAYELWAKEEVENPYRDESPTKAAGASQKPAQPAQPTLYKDLGVHLAKLGISDFGIKTVFAICKVNALEEIPDDMASKLMKVGSDHIKMFDQGKNSKGQQIIPPPVNDQISEKSSIEELAKAAEEMFSDD
jgi:hypothetical protein